MILQGLISVSERRLMLKKLLILSCLIILPACLFAQPKGYKAVADKPAFTKKMERAAGITNGLKAEFIQEKNLSAIEETIISSGTFLFKKPGKIRMEYSSPFKYLMIISDGKVTIRDGQKTNSFSSRGNKLFTLVNNIMIDCMQGTILTNKDFTHEIFENDSQYLVRLKPSGKEMKNYFESISVVMTKNEAEVLQIIMSEPSGDNTVIKFNNRQLNAKIPDTDFVVR